MATAHSRQRKAALKAWDTIRKNKREKAARGVIKIDNYISQKKINEIKHPETTNIINENKWSGNGVVKLFNKTPSNIACGPFWELRWAYGCPLNCSYCYLRGTMRGNMKPSFVKIETIERCLHEAFHNISKPTIFNSGELCDSLMNPPLMEKIVDIFENQQKHKILLLSKFGTKNIKFLENKPRKQTICAWSINAELVAKRWESNAATPGNRIKAAQKVWELGYDTRIRIDPIFPIENWQKKYDQIIEKIFSNLFPNKIILGTPRGLWKTISYAEKAGVDMSWAYFFKDDTDWGKKISLDERVNIYSHIIDKIETMNYPIDKISICKETIEMLNRMKIEYKINTCNCYGSN